MWPTCRDCNRLALPESFVCFECRADLLDAITPDTKAWEIERELTYERIDDDDEDRPASEATGVPKPH